MATDILSILLEEATNDARDSRIVSVASSSSVTINLDITDQYNITALAVGTTFNAPTGTLENGKPFIVRIKDNNTIHSLAWNAIFRSSSDFALPTTTVANKTIYLQFVCNADDNKIDAVGLTNMN